MADTIATDQEFRPEFDRFLDAAENGNLLYFLMTLFGGWASLAWTRRFIAQVNRITSGLILRRAHADPPEPIPPHELLFALQINLEAKAVYAVLRNLLQVAMQEPARPEPWNRKRGEYSVHKDGKVVLSTQRIIRNLVDDWRDLGFERLADELEITHIQSIAPVRNAIAHSTFCFPQGESESAWVFAEYARSGKDHIKIVPQSLSSSDLNRICGRFFAFRLAFMHTFDERLRRYQDRQFEFQARNQMKPDEVLDCTFDCGSVSVNYRGTPLW